MSEAGRKRPIIFSGPMVRALLEGRKTQTRRILKPQVKFGFKPWQDDSNGQWCQSGYGEAGDDLLDVPYVVGDRLWVRETWKPHSTFVSVPPREIAPSTVFYAADDRYAPSNTPWRSSIHMPRWASRLTLTVTDVRVERLLDISEADAIAEGVEPPSAERDEHDWSICPKCGGTGLHGSLGENLGFMEVDCRECDTHRKRYQHLWCSLHGPDAWAANPWVAAVTFQTERRNIDTPAGRRALGPTPQPEDTPND